MNEVERLRNLGARIGKNVSFVGPQDFSSEPYLCTIGDNTTLSFDVHLITHDAGTRIIRNLPDGNKETVIYGTINIGNNCFIGARSTILPNVNIGDNTLIGAGSVVTKDIPSNVVAAGVPCKIICTIDEWREKHKDDFLYMVSLPYEDKKRYLLNHFGLEKKKKILIVHFNTPKLTECLVKSINKFTPNAEIYIFDNSTTFPFVNTFENVTIFDNTKGQIINFEEWLENYPNRNNSGGKVNNFGSAKHTYTIQKCMELINDNFLLLDSDVLIKKDITPLFDDNKIFVSDVEIWKGHKRAIPFLCYINVNKCKEYGVKYFDEKRIYGLNISKDGETYDTGGSFFSDASKYDFKQIDYKNYIVHYRAGSWVKEAKEFHNYKPIDSSYWLKKYKNLWFTDNDKRKMVIYTCVTGGYDTLKTPTFLSKKFDYVCFTDKPELVPPSWITYPIPEELKKLSTVKQQRCIKINPHKFLPQYDVSIWIDGNVDVLIDVDTFVDDVKKDGKSVYIPRHPTRNCIYREETIVLKIKKDTQENTKPQIERYKKEGFPVNYGLVQSNIILRFHKDEKCIRLMEKWWEELKGNSHRDQLSFNYALWKMNANDCFEYLHKSTCKSKYFKWAITHKNTDKKHTFGRLDNKGKETPTLISKLHSERIAKLKMFNEKLQAKRKLSPTNYLDGI